MTKAEGQNRDAPESALDVSQTELMLKTASSVTAALGADALVVQADKLPAGVRWNRVHDQRVVWLTSEGGMSELGQPGDTLISVPEAPLTRLGQVRLGLFLGLLTSDLEPTDLVVCASGLSGYGRLDNILIADLQRDYPRVRRLSRAGERLGTKTVAKVLDLALRLASEGREGKSIGTMFVIDEMKALAPHVRQLVLNPFAGHPPAVRNIHSARLFESIREFAALDGAFLVSREGLLEAAGTYLDAVADDARLDPGQGARHAAGAAISAATGAIAVVISESSGTVTAFQGGEAVLELDRAPQR